MTSPRALYQLWIPSYDLEYMNKMLHTLSLSLLFCLSQIKSFARFLDPCVAPKRRWPPQNLTQQLTGFEVGLYLATIGQPLKSESGVSRAFVGFYSSHLSFWGVGRWDWCHVQRQNEGPEHSEFQTMQRPLPFCRYGRINWSVNIYWTDYPISTTLDCG